MKIPIWLGTEPHPQPVVGPEYAEAFEKSFLVAGRPVVD